MVLDTPTQEVLLGSGIGEIDKKLNGGLPQGSLTLIEGEADAGKTPLVQQFIWGCLDAGKKVALYTTENTPTSLLRQMRGMKLDVDDYFILSRLQVYNLPVAVAEDTSRVIYEMLLAHIQTLDVDIVFFDGITAFASHAEDLDTLQFFSRARELCDGGVAIVVTLHSYATPEELLQRLLSLCDAHLRLKVEDLGQRLCKTLDVMKIRGASRREGMATICFEVDPEMGLAVIPVFKAKL